jgi:hypothetical protein
LNIEESKLNAQVNVIPKGKSIRWDAIRKKDDHDDDEPEDSDMHDHESDNHSCHDEEDCESQNGDQNQFVQIYWLAEDTTVKTEAMLYILE